MSDCPIEIVDLRKNFGTFVAVDDLNLKVQKNSFTGLLGPNGAGKSTTLKILTNLIRATSGNAYLNGEDVTKDPKAALMGVGTVVETPEFYSYLTPNETFDYIGELYGMTKENIAAQTVRIMTDVHMGEFADKKIGTFSKGMRQRVALGLSLLNEPSIIILDEPTSGLDPRGMAETREILKDVRKSSKNLTILMSSHMLHEVSDMCDRVAMINHGKLLVHDTIDRVLGANDLRTINIRILGGVTDEEKAKIAALGNVEHVEASGSTVSLKFKGNDEDQMQLYQEVNALGLKVFNFNVEDALESVYLNLIKETK
jgi:ABC-2 type transport system ATP-binding protein